jgi:hypothetical protein
MVTRTKSTRRLKLFVVLIWLKWRFCTHLDISEGGACEVSWVFRKFCEGPPRILPYIGVKKDVVYTANGHVQKFF